MADPNVLTSSGGQYTGQFAGGAAETLIYTGAGRLCKFTVITAGSEALSFFDGTDSTTGTLIYSTVTNDPAGAIKDVQIPITTGIVVKGVAGSGGVSVQYNGDLAYGLAAVATGPGAEETPVSFLPSDYANLTLWGEPGTNGSELFQERTGASATTPATVATDPVGTWAFATGQYFTAPTDNTTRPLLALDGNGHLYPTADGTNDCLRGGDLSALFPSAGTLVYRFKITSDALAQLVVLIHENPIDGGPDGFDRWNTISNPGPLRAVRLESQPLIPRTSWVTVTIRSSASGWTRRVDGVEDINTTASYQAGTDWIMFSGFGPGDANPGKFMAGPIACVIAYSDIKSDLECEQLEAYVETVAPP